MTCSRWAVTQVPHGVASFSCFQNLWTLYLGESPGEEREKDRDEPSPGSLPKRPR